MFFKPVNQLPIAKEAGLSEHVVNEANRVVEEVLNDNEVPPVKKRRKYTMTFNPEDIADIESYAAQNENSAIVRKYEVGESTVRLFKKKYFAEIRARVKKIGQ